MHEAARRVWGLRLRRTEQELALARLFMLPSAHYKGVGVRIASFRSWMPTPPILCLRFVGSLAVATQDSRPSRSLVLSRETLSFSASCRFIPAHCNGDFSSTDSALFLPLRIELVRGQFDTVAPEKMNAESHGFGPGFGHLGQYQHRLILFDVSANEIRRNATPYLVSRLDRIV